MNTKLDFRLLEELWNKVGEALPKVIFGILFIIISWLLLKVILYIVKKSLKFSKIDYFTNKINEVPLLGLDLEIKPQKIILIFVKWFLILVFIIIGSDLLNLDLISQEVSKLVNYLPKFFGALVIFIAGMYGAAYLKKSIRSLLKAIDINGSKVISQIVFIILTVVVSIMTFNQIGLNTEIITNNLFLIVGAILASFAIAFGLGSKDVILRLLLGFYSKRNFKVGQQIIIDGNKGVIKSIDSITLVVAFDDKKIIYPIKYISNSKIEILN